MFRRKNSPNFNLAFLDVMSCGLGAVLLIFLIIKHNANVADSGSNDISPILNELRSEQVVLKTRIKSIEQDIDQAQKQKNKSKKIIAQTRNNINAVNELAKIKKAENNRLKKEIESIKPLESPDLINNAKLGEENYLIGLRVEGTRIAILVDHSASMTDFRLVDIIKRKISDDEIKKKGPKWRRTVGVVGWLLARLPENSKTTVIGYNETANQIGSLNWVESSNTGKLTNILEKIDQIVPQGPTNLNAALKKMNLMSPPPTNIYLITDGLPTIGAKRFSLSRFFSNCSSITGTGKTISGECRLKLFWSGVSQNLLSAGSKLNVILLPMEGDPEAAPAYWRWAAETGGILISPGEEWP